jgi:hypothetical protein
MIIIYTAKVHFHIILLRFRYTMSVSVSHMLCAFSTNFILKREVSQICVYDSL